MRELHPNGTEPLLPRSKGIILEPSATLGVTRFVRHGTASMKNSTLTVAFALSLLASGAALAQPGDPKVAMFAQDASLSNQFEIEEAKIILQDSKNPRTRAFARQMIHDHGMAQQMLDRAAGPSGSATRIVLDKGQQKLINALGLMDSPKLDETYVADQQESHARAIASVGDFAANGSDPSLRAWARATLPTIVRHQRELVNITASEPEFDAAAQTEQ